MLNTCVEESEPKEQKSRHAEGAKLDRSGLRRVITRRGPSLEKLCRPLIQHHAWRRSCLIRNAQGEMQSLHTLLTNLK